MFDVDTCFQARFTYNLVSELRPCSALYNVASINYLDTLGAGVRDVGRISEMVWITALDSYMPVFW